MEAPVLDPSSIDRTWLVGAVVVALALERLGELALSHRNLARLERDGVARFASSSGGEYGAMVLVHTLFVLTPPIEIWLRGMRGDGTTALAAVAAIAAAQALRWWTILTLGPRWNARAVVAPSLGAVHGGPYRFVRHPNYVAVILEFAALPFVGGTWISGGVLFLANAVLLARRVRQEERLLAAVPGWAEGFRR